jgi:hypothetical protein
MQSLATEADTAIIMLDEKEQKYTRQLLAKSI